MSETSSSSSSAVGRLGFSGALTVLFVALKLTGHIDWSWWWVCSPIWISGALGVLLIGAVLVFVLLKEAHEDRSRRR